MRHEHLADMPDFDLPDPFSLRWHEGDDERNWIDIHLRADSYNPADSALYEGQFGQRRNELARRQCFLLDGNGVAVGTATAWFGDDKGANEHLGRLHWVAIVPMHQGKGLAKPLAAAVCQRMCQLGHTTAWLSTNSERLPAVNLYFGLGFVPSMDTEHQRAAWCRMLTKDGLKPALHDLLRQQFS
ncbi:MAG: GNAT family N-acetyltransferase [Lentisphaeria bacterium]|nr:GNAT family N-acetyltransferase [Lentisphaeria bacterium]